MHHGESSWNPFFALPMRGSLIRIIHKKGGQSLYFRTRFVCIYEDILVYQCWSENEDRFRKRGQMHPHFRGRFLDLSPIRALVGKFMPKNIFKKIDLKTHQTISLNRVRSKFEEIIFLNVVKPKI